MFSLSSNTNSAWFVHWTHFCQPLCYFFSFKWTIGGFRLLLKSKDIAFIRKIKGNQNLGAIIQFMQRLMHYLCYFTISLWLNSVSICFPHKNWKRKIEHPFHIEDHEGPPLHRLTHWPPNEYGTVRPGWKAPICALNSFNLRCVWCAGGRMV